MPSYANDIRQILDRDLNILLVDDDPIHCSFAQLHLGSQRIRLTTVTDALNALGKASAVAFDFILVDFDMPTMNGLEFVQAVRRTPKHYRTPIIMITGKNDREMITEAYRAGVDFVDTKPVDWPMLAHQIKYVYERKSK